MKNNQTGMTLIVKTITRLTVGLILIYGVFIMLHGHTGPGGGFDGGIIIALSFIHLMLAFGKDGVIQKLNQNNGLILAGIGALIILLLYSFNLAGRLRVPAAGGVFNIFSGGLSPFYETALSLLAGTGLFVVFIALVLWRGGKEDR